MVEALVEAHKPGDVVHDTMVWPPLFEAAERRSLRQAMVVRARRDMYDFLDHAGPARRCDLLVFPYDDAGFEELRRQLPPGLPPAAVIGSVGRQSGAPPEVTRARLGVSAEVRLVLVTAGAGGFVDSPQFHALALAGLERALAADTAPHLVMLVLGPRYEGPLPLARGLTTYVWRELSWLSDVISAADLVLCQAGHNTMNEVLSAGTPAILLPAPRFVDDQFARARQAALRNPQLEAYEGRDPAELGELARRLLDRPRPAWSAPVIDEGRPEQLRRIIELGRVEWRDEKGMPTVGDLTHHD